MDSEEIKQWIEEGLDLFNKAKYQEVRYQKSYQPSKSHPKHSKPTKTDFLDRHCSSSSS